MSGKMCILAVRDANFCNADTPDLSKRLPPDKHVSLLAVQTCELDQQEIGIVGGASPQFHSQMLCWSPLFAHSFPQMRISFAWMMLSAKTIAFPASCTGASYS